MKKSIRNANAVACNLGTALTRATNHKLEVIREKRRKKNQIIKRWKTKAIVTKHQKTKKEICLSSEKEEYYESNTRDKSDPNKTNNIDLLPIGKVVGESYSQLVK